MSITLFDMVDNVMHVVQYAQTNWDGMHPLVVHFPIVLFFIAPIFFIGTLVLQKYARALQIVTLVLLILGVISSFLATSSGEMASEKLSYNPDVTETLSLHYHLAERTQLIFCILTVVYLVYVIWEDKITRRIGQVGKNVFSCLFLISLLFGLLVLTSAAHYGGKLVHFHSVQSSIFKESK